MLLQLENTNMEQIEKLMNFAKENQLQLRLIDDNRNNYFLPGKALSNDELINLLESSRQSGNITLKNAHALIKNSFNAG